MGQRTRKNKRRKRGGKAIAAGGFGCVFDPYITCGGDVDAGVAIAPYRSGSKVSKLMTTSDAITETDALKKIYSIVKTIPRFSNYFLFPMAMCPPAGFTLNDLVGYDVKCKKMAQQFPARRLLGSKPPAGLSILTMPHGGVELYKHIQFTYDRPTPCAFVFAGLAALIEDAIVPMNDKGVCHGDLKAENIMLGANGHMRIIDWGLGGIINKKAASLKAKFLENRPFQFNVPFTLPLLGNFKDFYAKSPPIKNIVAAKEYPVEGNSYVAEVINMFLARALGVTLNTGKLTGHLYYLEEDIVPVLFGGNTGTSADVEASRSTFRFTVSDYLVNVVNEYTKKGKFMRDDYIKEVFMKNADIWGALVSLISYVSPKATGLTATQRATTLELLRKYLFSSEYATKPIPPKAVCLELREIAASIMKPLSAMQVSRELPKPWVGMLHEELGASVGRKSSKGKKTKKQKRCPNGTRRNKRTGDCEPINS